MTEATKTDPALIALLENQQKLIQSLIGKQPKTLAESNTRVAEIKANANKAKVPEVVKPGEAILTNRAGTVRKLVEAWMVMQSASVVNVGDHRGDIDTGALFEQVKSGDYIVEQFCPYPDGQVVRGPGNFFNFQADGYVKDKKSGAYFHPQYGKKAMRKLGILKDGDE